MAIKRNYSLREKLALAEGLKALGKANNYLLRPISATNRELPEMEDYLMRPFSGDGADAEADKAFEKAVYTSVIATRPKLMPAAVAARYAQAAVEAMRYARIQTQDSLDKLTSRQYRKLIAGNWAANIISTALTTEKFALKHGLSYTIGSTWTLLEPVSGSIAFCSFLIYDMIPERVKKRIKEKAVDVSRKAAVVVRNAAVRLRDKAQTVVGNVAEALERGVERVSRAAEPVVQKVKHAVSAAVSVIQTGLNRISSTASKVKEKISRWFR